MPNALPFAMTITYLLCSTLFCPTLPCPALTYPALPCDPVPLPLPCPALPYHAMVCYALVRVLHPILPSRDALTSSVHWSALHSILPNLPCPPPCSASCPALSFSHFKHYTIHHCCSYRFVSSLSTPSSTCAAFHAATVMHPPCFLLAFVAALY